MGAKNYQRYLDDLGLGGKYHELEYNEDGSLKYSIFHVYIIQCIQYIRKKMKPDSSEFGEKIVKIYEQDDTSIRKVAA